VDVDDTPVVEDDELMLAPAVDGVDLRAAKRPQTRRPVGTAETRMQKRHDSNRLSDDRAPKGANRVLDFRQLRHCP
jgi:hypothetical protein